MAADSWVYDGGTWRNIATWWAYDGTGTPTGWRDIQEAWSYDGSTWRKVFEAVSCPTATCDSGTSTWTEATCTDANECNYCIGVNTTDCTDPCHNIDGFVSQNGGSFLGSLPCRNEGCTQQTGTDCSAEMDCMLNSGGTRCYSDSGSPTVQGRVTVEDDSDGTDNCSYTGSTRSGPCLA